MWWCWCRNVDFKCSLLCVLCRYYWLIEGFVDRLMVVKLHAVWYLTVSTDCCHASHQILDLCHWYSVPDTSNWSVTGKCGLPVLVMSYLLDLCFVTHSGHKIACLSSSILCLPPLLAQVAESWAICYLWIFSLVCNNWHSTIFFFIYILQPQFKIRSEHCKNDLFSGMCILVS